MKLKYWIVTFFYILKFLCLMPVSLNSDTMKLKSSKISEMSSIFFCIFLILIDKYVTENLLYIKSAGYDIHNFRFIDIINNGTYLLMIICVFWSIYKTKHTLLIFEKIEFIQGNLKKLNARYDYVKRFQSFIKVTVAIQAVPIISHYIFQIVQDKAVTSQGLFYLTIVAIKYMIGSVVLIQMNAVLLSIKCILSMISRIINQISLESNEIKIDCRVCELSKIYRTLCEIKKLFAERFSIPVIAIIIYLFAILIAQYTFKHLKLCCSFQKIKKKKIFFQLFVCLRGQHFDFLD